MTVINFFVALCILQILDIASTVGVLANGGRELNPLARWLMMRLGVIPALVLLKSIFLYAMWVYALPPEFEFELQIVILGFYSAVVVSNIHQYNKSK
jgi:Domain of unknown function (DUF5658)